MADMSKIWYINMNIFEVIDFFKIIILIPNLNKILSKCLFNAYFVQEYLVPNLHIVNIRIVVYLLMMIVITELMIMTYHWIMKNFTKTQMAS